MTPRKPRKKKCPTVLDLTDRMRAQGVEKTCWYSGATCGKYGAPVVTNGLTTWCAKGEHG